MEKKKNTVNLNEKKSYTRTEKNKNIIKKPIEVKNDIKLENIVSKRKLIISIILGIVVIGLLTFGVVKIFGNNNEEPNDKKPIIEDLEPEKEPIAEKDKEDEENDTLVYVSNKENNKIDEENKEDEEPLIYRLTYDTNGGEEIEEELYYSNVVTQELESNPEREGWIFDGWYKDSDLTENFVFGSYLTEDTTIYAGWAKKIEFYNEDLELLDTKYVKEGQEIEFYTDDNIYEDDNTAPGWFYTVDDISREILPGTIVNDVTFPELAGIVDLYLTRLNKFELTFMYGGDTPHTQTVIEGRQIDFTGVETKIADERPNVIEYGWTYTVEGDPSPWDFSKDRVADINITVLTLTETVFTITYEEEIEDTSPVQYEEIDVIEYSGDSKVTVLIPEEQVEKIFDGWYLKDDNGITLTKVDNGYLLTGDITVIAKWMDVTPPPVLSVPPVSTESINNTSNEEILEEEPLDEVVDETLVEEQENEQTDENPIVEDPIVEDPIVEDSIEEQVVELTEEENITE